MTPYSRALITGASAGIGRSFALQLAAGGHALVLVARRAELLERLASQLRDEHGVEVEVLPADLASGEGVNAVVRRIEADPAIDMLINNAGYAVRGKVVEADADALETMLRVNILAVSRLSAAAMAQMTVAGRGAIINVSSGTIFMQLPGNAGYGASKSYVAYLTRTMQVEARDSGVHIQLLIPGVIDTDFHEIAGSSRGSFPPNIVMQADDLVSSSLKALAAKEPVCIPSLPEITDWDAYAAAERQIASNVSRSIPAVRYR